MGKKRVDKTIVCCDICKIIILTYNSEDRLNVNTGLHKAYRFSFLYHNERGSNIHEFHKEICPKCRKGLHTILGLIFNSESDVITFNRKDIPNNFKNEDEDEDDDDEY